MRLPRLRFTVRQMMAAVAVVALACFLYELVGERVGVCCITQCYGGRVVPLVFTVLDEETRTPVPRAKLTLSGRDTLHSLATGPDGLAKLTFQPGCDERIYPRRGLVYTVYYSNWELGIEAEGYESVRRKLSSYRRDTCYPGVAVPPPIIIRITRRAITP